MAFDAGSGALAPELEARALGKSFGARVIFQDVSFALRRGEVAALVGANGAGKSTLLRSLIGAVAADAGEALLFGQSVGGLRGRALRDLRAQTGMVAQRHNLAPRLSVLSNVIHGLLGRSGGPRFWTQALAPAEARDAAMAALERVGLADLALRRADRLSGGQSQRVAIARALVGGPRLLIADEPTASLDPSAGEDVMTLFLSLAREQGATVVFTSHDVAQALRCADRLLGLHEGGLKIDAPATSLMPSDLAVLYG